jgi:hypothetical protein
MSEFLTKDYIELYKDEIKEDFDRLLKTKQIVGRREALRWCFFRHCFDVLTGMKAGDFVCSQKQARDYKFRIKQSLDKHNRKTVMAKPSQFTFHLEEIGKKNRLLGNDADYPNSNGYLLLVLWRSSSPPITPDMENIFYKVIDRAINAKYELYHNLPRLRWDLLEDCFATGGPAYRQIIDRINRHQSEGAVISNEDNQSHKKLLELKVHRLWENKAEVSTKEFWHLHWWSSAQNTYTKEYKGVTLQAYTLTKNNNHWLIESNPCEAYAHSAL